MCKQFIVKREFTELNLHGLLSRRIISINRYVTIFFLKNAEYYNVKYIKTLVNERTFYLNQKSCI